MLCKPGSNPKFQLKISSSIYCSKGRNLAQHLLEDQLLLRLSDEKHYSILAWKLLLIIINNLIKIIILDQCNWKIKLVTEKQDRNQINWQLSEIRIEGYLKFSWEMMISLPSSLSVRVCYLPTGDQLLKTARGWATLCIRSSFPTPTFLAFLASRSLWEKLLLPLIVLTLSSQQHSENAQFSVKA